MNREQQDDRSEGEDNWLERAVHSKRREKEAIAKVFSGTHDALQKDQEILKEKMKKEEVPPEEKGGPLYTPLSKDLDSQIARKKAISKVFDSEQEKREKQRQALKSWILGGDEGK
ncbi:MAG: hypothetical protein AB9903_15590 [Vulcanimicrobiota bacterium]